MAIKYYILRIVVALLLGVFFVLWKDVRHRSRIKKSWEQANPKTPVQVWYLGRISTEGPVGIVGRILLLNTTIGDLRKGASKFYIFVPKGCGPNNPMIVINHGKKIITFPWDSLKETLSHFQVVTFEEVRLIRKAYLDDLKDVRKTLEKMGLLAEGAKGA